VEEPVFFYTTNGDYGHAGITFRKIMYRLSTNAASENILS
jgi:hypothetical protein